MDIDSESELLKQARELEEVARQNLGHEDYGIAFEKFQGAADKYMRADDHGTAAICYANAARARELLGVTKSGMDTTGLITTPIAVWVTIEHCYHQARLAFQQVGLHTHARKAYVGEMDARRKVVWIRIREDINKAKELGVGYPYWIWLSILKLSCGYGERPARLLLWTSLVVITFAIAYYPNPWGWGFIELEGVEWSAKSISIHNAIESLYFSVVTFATLGYGDIRPANDLARIYICVEVFAGYMVFALFVTLMARRITYS